MANKEISGGTEPEPCHYLATVLALISQIVKFNCSYSCLAQQV